jgi:hypothetical protein
MKYQNLSYAIAMSMGLLTTPLALADFSRSQPLVGNESRDALFLVPNLWLGMNIVT